MKFNKLLFLGVIILLISFFVFYNNNTLEGIVSSASPPKQCPDGGWKDTVVNRVFQCYGTMYRPSDRVCPRGLGLHIYYNRKNPNGLCM